MVEELSCPGAEFYELGKKLVESGLSLRVAVSGRSMYPFLRDGDVITVVPSGIEELRIGDIIFYRSGSRLLAHRVVGFVLTPEGRRVRARGDAFLQEDPSIAQQDLIGRLELVSRRRRDGWHQIPLRRGCAKLAGVVMARSKIIHRSVRWLSRAWLRVKGLRRRWLGPDKDRAERKVVDVENPKL